MKHNFLRPLAIVVAIVGLVFLVRLFAVPKDFGSSDRGYRFGWHRASDEEYWKNVSVKYKGAEYCSACHDKNAASLAASPHRIIQCEDCHGPALDHPADPAKLVIDTSRALCLRCHYPLPYPTSGRAAIRGIDPEVHNPGIDCASCHNPHSPVLGRNAPGAPEGTR
jgi:predicted CXXCH cytochrome family protein